MAKSLQEHLVSGDSMAHLAAHANRLLQLQGALKAALPAAMRPYAHIANFRLGKVFIHTNNSEVAAKIRQLGPRLASALSSPTAQVTEIEVRVQASTPSVTPSPHERPALPGDHQKQGLTLLAESLPHESTLKGALERLLQAIKK